jgi:hypothetical protein
MGKSKEPAMADDPTVTDPEADPTVVDPTTTEPDPVEEEWTPPTREEAAAQQKAHDDEIAALKKADADKAAALKRVNAESANRKRQIAEIQQQHEDDDTKAKREATEAALAQLKPVAIKATATAAFMGAGADETQARKLLRLLDLSKVDIDGEVVHGLDEQVDEIKADWPELFAKPESTPTEQQPQKPKTPAAQLGDRKPPKTVLSPMEQLAAQVAGRTQ